MKHINPHQFISDVAQFIRRCVACSDDQLTILTLWVFSGYFRQYYVFPFAACLNIYSAEPQSGKTVLLKTLEHLAYRSWYTSGASARVLLAKMRCFGGTLLLDDRHVTFSPSERQAVVAYFNAGVTEHGWYGYLHPEEDDGVSDHSCFAPKAFAGQGSMPSSLASRCIPINLERSKPSEPLERLRWETASDISEEIVDRLELWAQQNRQHLRPLALHAPADMPSGLTPHQQHAVEPLVHIADFIGAPWPERIRAAITHVFAADACDNPGSNIPLLSDIRDFFAAQGNPEFLLTRDLLAYLHGLEERAWKHWKNGRAMTPHALAHELRPLHIHSCLDWNSAEPARGYRYENFLAAWDLYLPDATSAVSSPEHSITELLPATTPDAPDLTLQSVRNSQSVREIPAFA